MAQRGCMTYIPKELLVEVQAIQQRLNIRKRSKAFIELVKYSRVGREAENILKLRF